MRRDGDAAAPQVRLDDALVGLDAVQGAF